MPFMNNETPLSRIYNIKLKEAINNFHKLTFFRQKRGLANFLGSAIKFITGNPDNDDLEIINDNIKSISDKTDEQSIKINKLISNAQHIQERFHLIIDNFNSNNKQLEKYLRNIQNDLGIHEAQINIANIEHVNDFLLMLLRTITFSKLNLTNLELFSADEITRLEIELEKFYDTNQIISTNLLEHCQTILIHTNYKIILILKIPILKVKSYPLIKVFPIPNEDKTLILPPTSWNSHNDWFEICQQISIRHFFCNKKITSNCSITNPHRCPTAKAESEIEYDLPDGKIVYSPTKTFRCNQSITVDCYTIQCTDKEEDVTPEFYTHNLPSARNKLILQKMDIPTGFDITPIQPLHLHPVATYISWSISTSCLLFILAFIYIMVKKKKRIHHFLNRPRVTRETLELFLKEGGVTDADPAAGTAT